MPSIVTAIQNKLYQLKKKKYIAKVNSYVQLYLQQHQILQIIQEANKLSGSTGVSNEDYVSLHAYIRNKKPLCVLECGTGKSTWVIAAALKQNFEETGIKGKVVSMEDEQTWYNEAVKILPSIYNEYVQLVYAPKTIVCFAMFRGTAYTTIPDNTYDLFFVDGPDPMFEENGQQVDSINMDFIRYVMQAEKPVTAMVDYRLKTTAAYGFIFGKHKMKFLKPWNMGIVENVTKHDLNIEKKDFDTLFTQVKINTLFGFETPSWIEL